MMNGQIAVRQSVWQVAQMRTDATVGSSMITRSDICALRHPIRHAPCIQELSVRTVVADMCSAQMLVWGLILSLIAPCALIRLDSGASLRQRNVPINLPTENCTES